MSERDQAHEVLPDLFKRLVNLNSAIERAADTHGIDRRLLELVKVRASQINGCAHCTELHLGGARTAGEAQRRLDLLVTWRETDLFTPAERAALALTEAMSRTSSTQEVPEAVYAAAAEHFSAEQLSVVIWAASLIQAFNALNVTIRRPIGEPKGS